MILVPKLPTLIVLTPTRLLRPIALLEGRRSRLRRVLLEGRRSRLGSVLLEGRRSRLGSMLVEPNRLLCSHWGVVRNASDLLRLLERTSSSASSTKCGMNRTRGDLRGPRRVSRSWFRRNARLEQRVCDRRLLGRVGLLSDWRSRRLTRALLLIR